MASIRDDIRMRWATGGMVIRLILVNVGVFLLLSTLGLLETLGIPVPNPGGAFGLATSSDLHVLIRRPWSIVTHMFVHLGVWHLVMNLLILWWMGGMFRSYFAEYGTWFPIVQEIFPNLGYSDAMRVEQRMFVPVVGASGAVFGLLLGFGMLFPNTRLQLLFPPVPIKARYFVLGYGAIELLMALQNNPGDNVAHFAHLGGMIFGYLLLKKWQKDRDVFY